MRSPRPMRSRIPEATQWNENRDRLADDLIGLIAEKPLRTAVPTGDDAVEVFADDRVIGEFHDRGLAAALGAFAISDVDKEVQRSVPDGDDAPGASAYPWR
jgi:hypothetical protein